ncbi:LysE family translocator [Prosthecomicrobium hirschii]|uniref:LysE family translocator n=1 Tax=Prosthecodimorpha hirschii TaxID=665126 RepID=UPI002220B81A|nr:LysE family translocator [Prosthecomicrobium hirschii]
MIDIWLVVKGIGIGILFSAPIGPVNIMCIQLAFRRGFLAGLAAGIGAVFADGLFAALAAYGFTATAAFIAGYSSLFQLVGGLVLIVFGIRIMRMHPHLAAGGSARDSILSTALTSFGMTVTNPATVLGFIAVFGSLGDLAPAPGDYLGATLLVLGVLAGGCGWWFFVASLVSVVRDKLTDRGLERINQGAGAVLILFGAAILGRLACAALGLA